LEVCILGGDHNGDIALIPCIGLIPSTEEGYTFQFKHHQFPVRLAFVMTINKAEGQSLHTVGIDLLYYFDQLLQIITIKHHLPIHDSKLHLKNIT